MSWFFGNSSFHQFPETSDCFLSGRTWTRWLMHTQLTIVFEVTSVKIPKWISYQISIQHGVRDPLPNKWCLWTSFCNSTRFSKSPAITLQTIIIIVKEEFYIKNYIKMEFYISKACFYPQNLYKQEPWSCYLTSHPLHYPEIDSPEAV